MGRLSWIILNPTVHIYIRSRQRVLAHTDVRESRIKVMRTQAQELEQPPETGRGRKDSP